MKEKESTSSPSTKTTTTVVDETKNMIKKRIESIEDLEPKDVKI